MFKEMRQIKENVPEDKISLAEKWLAGTPAIMNCHEGAFQRKQFRDRGRAAPKIGNWSRRDENGLFFDGDRFILRGEVALLGL